MINERTDRQFKRQHNSLEGATWDEKLRVNVVLKVKRKTRMIEEGEATPAKRLEQSSDYVLSLSFHSILSKYFLV